MDFFDKSMAAGADGDGGGSGARSKGVSTGGDIPAGVGAERVSEGEESK